MHFVITFGFSVTFRSDTHVTVIEHGDKSIVKKKKGVDRRKRKKTNENEFETVEHKKNVINVDRILANVHVEYELVPGYNFKFDCCCWDTAAKIYSENEDRCLKIVTSSFEENTVWAVFSVHHVMELKETQLRRLFDHTITLRIFFGRAKFSDRAKKDKVKHFYARDDTIDIHENDFLEIYPLNNHQDSNSLIPTIPEPVIVTDTIDGDFNVVTYLDPVPDSMHSNKFWKTLKKARFPSEALKSGSFNVSNGEEQNPILKKLGKPVRNKQSKINASRLKHGDREIKHELTLPAETVFSDMGIITLYNRIQDAAGVSSILMYVHCEDILSSKQMRMNLNPLSIKLGKLSNFPSDIAIDKGFRGLYAKIIFADRTIVTPYYIPDRIIRFEYIKTFLCEEFQPEQLISFLTTEVLVVEIIGLRNVSVTNTSTISDSLPKQSEILKTVSPSQEEILLGVALFDTYELLQGSWEVRLRSSLFHPQNVYFENINYLEHEDSMASSWMNSPFTSDLLTSLNTSVKVTVRVACDLRAVHREVLRRSDILNRIFLILNDLQLANEILIEVFLNNRSVLCTVESPKDTDQEKVKETTKNLLTGFAIHCCDKVYIFLEGLSNGYLLKVWQKAMVLSASSGYVYYNSDYIFLARLYEEFLSFDGIITVTLSAPLEKQLRKYDLYVGKTGTTCRAKILKTMGLMKLSSTMRSLCQARIFPNSRSLKTFYDNLQKIYFDDRIKFTNK